MFGKYYFTTIEPLSNITCLNIVDEKTGQLLIKIEANKFLIDENFNLILIDENFNLILIDVETIRYMTFNGDLLKEIRLEEQKNYLTSRRWFFHEIFKLCAYEEKRIKGPHQRVENIFCFFNKFAE